MSTTAMSKWSDGGIVVNGFSFDGRTALVTGANTGIGQAIAVALAEAGADPVLAGFIRHLWSAEILPSLQAPPGVELAAYTDALFARYTNPAIRHRTWQIAMDGSQKLPQNHQRGPLKARAVATMGMRM